MTTDAYSEFLATKAPKAEACGFTVARDALPLKMKDFQADITQWACARGRAALFEGTGLGKTFQELTWAREVHRETGRPVLIQTPLAVAEQTVSEAEKFDIDGVSYAADQDGARTPIVVTNYDRGHLFDIDRFGGVVLGESSILKAHDGKTRQRLTDSCKDVPYLLCETATPAPNDWTELGQHAEFLGVCSAKEMLSMYFVHDGSNRAHDDSGADGWRLKRHAEREFWAWVASWSVMIRSPADLGYDEPGYDLPPLRKHQITVPVEYGPTAGMLFPMAASTLQERIAARKSSLPQRVAMAVEIVLGSACVKLAACPGSPNTPNGAAKNTSPTRKSASVDGSRGDPQRKTGSTCANTAPNSRINSGAAASSKTPSTNGDGSDTPPTPSSLRSAELTPKGETRPQSEKRASAPSTGSEPPSTTPCLSGRTADAQSAAEVPERSVSAGASPSITATQAESSEGSFAKAATTASGSSATTRTSSNAPRNISARTVSEPWLVWCHLNDEQDALAAAFGQLAFSVYGSMPAEEKVRCIRRWVAGERPIMISKPSIMGWGLNFQFCRKMVFVGLNDSFEEVYQALRRCWRFGQTEAVDAYMIASELEGAVVANQDRKERDFERMQAAMAEHMRDLTRQALRGGRVQASSFNPTQPMELPSWMAA